MNMLSHGTAKAKQGLMPVLQMLVFLALLLLREQRWLQRGSHKVTAKSIRLQVVKKAEEEDIELNI